ncbi:MAG: AAA family ATPase [Proteobacteria bacterium]|nr:AAA family ATPase [Pseudomonadota bacterium]
MATPEQDATIAFLASPAAFGGAAPVQRIDTHFSVVTIAGDRVLKLKRALINDLLDYGTPARRRQACMDELAVNRRSAPGLYRDVLAVTREQNGELALGGKGEAIDWVVLMRRFDENGLFRDLAQQDRLTATLVDGAADAVARLHDVAEATPDHGGLEDMRWIVEGNVAALEEAGGKQVDAATAAALARASRDALARHGDLLEQRRREGMTRRCHGDLHLGNICLVEGVPTLFDAIEFNDCIACCDLLYDLAFLVMDLWARGHRSHANRVLNRYLWRTADWQGLPLLPLFLSCRAAIRAKTSLWAAQVQESPEAAGEQHRQARSYLDLALACLQRPAPALLTLGGLSGTGKTTLAMTLAEERPGIPGALVVRSDVLRKQLAGVPFEEPLPRGNYTREASAAVYHRLEAVVARGLDAGLSVIADAVFLRNEEREAIAAVARRAECPFAAFWLKAPQATLRDRVEERRRDASDADAEVVDLQARQDPGNLAWPRLDTRQGPQAVAEDARKAL